MGRRQDVEKRVVRGLIQGLVVLGIIAAVIGMVPGIDKYRGGTLVETEPVAGGGLLVFELVAGLPLLFVYRRPTPLLLWVWSLLLWVGSVAVIAATFHLDFGDWGMDYTYQYRAAHDLFPIIAWPLGILAYVAIPFGGMIYWVVLRIQDVREHQKLPPPPEAPTAIVVKR